MYTITSTARSTTAKTKMCAILFLLKISGVFRSYTKRRSHYLNVGRTDISTSEILFRDRNTCIQHTLPNLHRAPLPPCVASKELLRQTYPSLEALRIYLRTIHTIHIHDRFLERNRKVRQRDRQDAPQLFLFRTCSVIRANIDRASTIRDIDSHLHLPIPVLACARIPRNNARINARRVHHRLKLTACEKNLALEIDHVMLGCHDTPTFINALRKS